MTKTLASFAFCLSLLSTAVTASAQDTSKSDPDEMICKREKKVNSRFTTQTCHTRAQWAAIAEQNKRDYAESRDRPSIDIRRDQ